MSYKTMTRLLEGKVIIVTGAGSGIGKVCAQAFSRAGAKVVVSDYDQESGLQTLNEIKSAKGEGIYIRANVADETEVEALVNSAIESYGRLDGALNNAGIGMRNKPVHELTAKDWQEVIDVDLTGVFYCIKHQVLAMMTTGGGSIVNTASAAGLRGQINASDYVAAKHGVVGLTKAAAVDCGSLNIRVNAICPGLIMTPLAKELMADEVFSKAMDTLKTRHIIGRFGEPEEIADSAIWLLSDHSRFVTGTPLTVDGGYSI
jgi:NAD(P)-dependent dehydrogenase (short-subunit alcohol dehydrogenase family)